MAGNVQVGMPARRQKAGSKPWVMKGKKRSEVDRRLDILVGPSGKLKDGATSAVVGMLRLFNLCDVAPSVTQAEPSRRERERERELRASSPALAQSTQVLVRPFPFVYTVMQRHSSCYCVSRARALPHRCSLPDSQGGEASVEPGISSSAASHGAELALQAADRRPADGDAAQDRHASPAVSPRVTPRRSASPSASHSSREHISDPGKADANGATLCSTQHAPQKVLQGLAFSFSVARRSLWQGFLCA